MILSLIQRLTEAERIGDAVDVIEPGGNERDLENSNVVEADRAEPVEVIRSRLVGCFGQQNGKIEHGTVLLG